MVPWWVIFQNSKDMKIMLDNKYIWLLIGLILGYMILPMLMGKIGMLGSGSKKA